MRREWNFLDVRFFLVGPNAEWRDMRWTHESYLSQIAAGRLNLPTVFEAIGLRVECVMIDVLHTVDQGVASHVIANMFGI